MINRRSSSSDIQLLPVKKEERRYNCDSKEVGVWVVLINLVHSLRGVLSMKFQHSGDSSVRTFSPENATAKIFLGETDTSTYTRITLAQEPAPRSNLPKEEISQTTQRTRTVKKRKRRKMARSLPNIVVTGTPGTGKTSHSELLAERTGLKHISVNDVVKDRECHEGWDDEYQSWIVDEDKVGQLTHPVTFSFFHLISAYGTLRPLSRSAICMHRYSSGWMDVLTEITAARRHRGRGQAGRVHNRLARVRPVPQELDRPGRGAARGHGDAV
jgi:hypothetical protein